ncbi:hypothetical protein BAUCODRAFT_33037 [Baudoinia panamericana UAMH 10762]|uniref:Uncharacterized protein n=1 Tax=Baudoinia panamericana (strain UAMH 10762) TaxID=717646 RepID=M2N058_BAUPA|nr:uncharacterized protein BAUCODRAFT_33037 [Baudoinia panamericana UAMH 10762]EMC97313.1 hypothetical protein BAUCODRAFT_33037 [Baudoinia panamericana UAMH 10762]
MGKGKLPSKKSKNTSPSDFRTPAGFGGYGLGRAGVDDNPFGPGLGPIQGHGSYLPGMPGHWPGSQAEDDKTKYEPSQSVRDLIRVRLEEQHDLLRKIINKEIWPLLQAYTEGQATAENGAPKTAGDQQIDAKTVKSVVDSARNRSVRSDRGPSGKSFWGDGEIDGGSTGNPYGWTPDGSKGLGGAYYGLYSGMLGHPHTPSAAMPGYKSNTKKDKMDPIQRFEQIDTEMRALVALTSDQNQGGMPRLPARNSLPTTKRRDLRSMLMKVLEPPAKGDSDSDFTEADAASVDELDDDATGGPESLSTPAQPGSPLYNQPFHGQPGPPQAGMGGFGS